MSWKSAAWPSRSSSACESPAPGRSPARAPARASSGRRCRRRGRRPWPTGDSIAAVERSLSSRLACSSETFWVWIVSAAWRSFWALFCVWREVGLLRLAHQQQRHREDGEGEHARRGVRDRDHAADEAVHDPVRERARRSARCQALHQRSWPSIASARLTRPVLTAKYAAPAARPAATVTRSPRRPSKPAVKIPAAASEASESAPMLKSDVVDRRAPGAPLDDARS